MTNQNTQKNRQLDDQLAEFTDQLLDQKIPLDLPEMDSQEQTLLELKETVARLAIAFGDETIDEAAAQRIESNLKREWQKMGATESKVKPRQPWWQGISAKLSQWKPARNQKRAYTLALASLTTIVIVVSLSVFFPEIMNDPNLPGTALGESFPFPALIIFAVIIGLVYLFVRNRR